MVSHEYEDNRDLATLRTSRAITIEDSPEGLKSADEILPRLQAFVIGDDVPISAVASMTFHDVEPNRHITWLGDEAPNPGAFTWALYPLDESRTRLVSRISWTYHPTSIGIFALELFTEFADHIAVRKVLQRVERNIEPMWIQNVELLTFICTLLTFLTALARPHLEDLGCRFSFGHDLARNLVRTGRQLA